MILHGTNYGDECLEPCEIRFFQQGAPEYEDLLTLAGSAYSRYWSGQDAAPEKLIDSLDYAPNTTFAALIQDGKIVAGLRWVPVGDWEWFFEWPNRPQHTDELTRFCPKQGWLPKRHEQIANLFREELKRRGHDRNLDIDLGRHVIRACMVLIYRRLSIELLAHRYVQQYLEAFPESGLLGVMPENIEKFYSDCGVALLPCEDSRLYSPNELDPTSEGRMFMEHYASYWQNKDRLPKLRIMSRDMKSFELSNYISSAVDRISG